MNKNTIYDGNIYVIGITGSIASGKSLVGSQLKSMGIAVIDLDHLTHELLNKQGPVYDQVITRFGQDIAPSPGAPIDRKKLGGIVFGDEKARKDLEAILHPAIRDLRDKKINDLASLRYDVVAVLVPLLFETNSQNQYNEVWMVTAHEDIQLVRLVNRDKLSEADARKRLTAQWPQDKKVQLADRIINNSGSPGLTLERVKTVLNEAQIEAKKPRVKVPVTTASSGVTKTPTANDAPLNPATPAVAGQTALDDGNLEADLTAAQVTGPAAETALTPPATPPVPPAEADTTSGNAPLNPPAIAAAGQTVLEEGNLEADLTAAQVTGPAAETTAIPPVPPTEADTTSADAPPNPAPQANPASHPHRHLLFRHQTILLAFFALLAFLATLVALTLAAKSDAHPEPAQGTKISENAVPVKALRGDTGEAVLKLLEQGGQLFKPDCARGGCKNQLHFLQQSTAVSSPCGQVTSSEEAPAFAFHYLHNEVRWQVALWNLSNDHINCQATVLEGRNRDGNLVVRQHYGKTLAFLGQYTVAYAPSSIRIDRFNSYNRFDGRTVYHFNEKGRLVEATLLNSEQRPVSAIFVEYHDGTTSISKEASYTNSGAIDRTTFFANSTEAQNFINNTFYLPELISGN